MSIKHNWDKISLFEEWEHPECEYNTSIGKIDMLSKHRSEKRWLIIELKKDQSSDDTVGQILRYMGWVKAALAEKWDNVEGLILSESADLSIKYALSCVSKAGFKVYYFFKDNIYFVNEPYAFDKNAVKVEKELRAMPESEPKALLDSLNYQSLRNH